MRFVLNARLCDKIFLSPFFLLICFSAVVWVLKYIVLQKDAAAGEKSAAASFRMKIGGKCIIESVHDYQIWERGHEPLRYHQRPR